MEEHSESGDEFPEDDTQVPSAQDLEEKRLLLSIFPAEVWEKILESMKAPRYKIKACNTAPFFRELLFTQRPIFLFPSVWEILYSRYKANFNRRDVSDPFNFQTTLACRAVSRVWSECIDKTYENRDLQLQPFKSDNENAKNLCIRSPSFSSLDTVNLFFAKFRDTHNNDKEGRSPFVTRRAIVKFYFHFDNRGQFDNIFSTALCRPFEMYGNHIRYLEIDFVSVSSLLDNTSVLDFYTILQRLLSCTPNLLKLQISHRLVVPALAPPNLANFIAGRPLPPLEHLLVLQSSEAPPLIAQQLFDKYHGVRSLAVEYSKPEHFPEILEFLGGKVWPNLEHLSLEFEDISARVVPCRCMPQEPPDNRVSFHHLFGVLEQMCAKTLTTLLVTLPDDGDNPEPAPGLALNLPLMKDLTLIWNGVRCPATPMDFVLPMQESLEMLEMRNVKVGKEDDERWMELLRREEQRPIQFWKYVTCPAKSTLWKEFENMRELCIKEKIVKGETSQIRCVTRPLLALKRNRQ